MIEYYITGYYISAIYSEFEDDIYRIVEKNEYFDTKLLNELMTEKLNNIYSDIIEDTSIISRKWINVKQFYNSYYVFNYASSTAYAIIIYSKLKSDKAYYKKFIQFLKKGKSLSNKKLLEMLNIEINDIEVYRTVNNELNKLLIEFNRLIENNVVNKH